MQSKGGRLNCLFERAVRGEHLGYGSYSGGFRRNPADDGGLDAGPDGWREIRLQVKANP